MENCQTIAAITTSRRIAPSQEIRNLYLNMCRMEDSGFASDFELDLQPGTQQVTALAAYFDCTFELPLLVRKWYEGDWSVDGKAVESSWSR
ncbi:uncharacterized protein LOC142558626 isoform X4 [Dermacentor variabilis]